MKKKKILIFFDSDVTVRHFIANDTFNQLQNNNELIYVFNKDKQRFNFENNKIINKKIPNSKIRYTFIPRKRIGVWYLLYIINLFRQHRIALRQKASKKHYKALKRFYLNEIGKRNLTLARLAGYPIIYQIINFVFSFKLGIHEEVTNLIEIEKPDLLIHPSFLHGYFINELFKASPRYGIPFIILTNSWDNCCTKAFCTGLPDKLVVWGEHSQRHAKQYIGMSEENILCFGAAQFEVYKKPPEEDRETLAKLFQVKSNKKILLYAGVGSSENETANLELLENAIENSILPDCHVIYRPHPWRGGLKGNEKDFLSLNWKHISIDPTMLKYYKSLMDNTRKDSGMYLTDYSITNRLLTLVDAVISPFSTMLIESMIKGKPVLAFLKYDQQLSMSNEFIHFAEFVQLEETNTCYLQENFISECEKLVSQIGDKSFSEKLRKTSKFFVNQPKVSYGFQLAQLADKLIKS
tara:strand:+ start:6327 stop:7724 length:1398 start_codon:yes stop_codon:yes gene_type:complete